MSHQIKQPAPDQVRVELFGNFDARMAAALETELAQTVNALTGDFHVLVFTTGLSDCAMDARDGLVRAQKVLARRARRTAWIDDRARFRGLALWVMHLAEDGNAKAVATLELARQWCASSVDRVADIDRRLGVSG